MNIDDRMLMDLADQIGIKSNTTSGETNTKDALHRAEQAASQMQGKSEEELLSEILHLKEGLKGNRFAYEKQIRAIKSLRGMMNPEQRKRLDQVLKLLED